MGLHVVKKLFLLFSIVGLFSFCTKKKTAVAWENALPVLGSLSSPRATDLNGDGTLDLVIGAGANERQKSDKAILAFDGKTGAILWQQSANDQVFGSPTFLDVTNDGVEDVFIGGRGNTLKALDGKTGTEIWAYQYHFENDSILQYARFNFYNSVLTPDQNGDGFQDLLIQCGGNIKAAPSSLENRFPGVLILFSSKSGQIIAADTMPDGMESYMTPLYVRQPDQKDYIVFGSGGETFGGHLYIARLEDLLNRQLSSKATIIAEESEHGFIAPPVLADVNADNYLDIIAISHASTLLAIDGKSRQVIWKQKIVGTESSNSFAVGYFNKDKTPDFFTFVSKGAWPENTGSLQIMLDGRNGNVLFRDSIGCTGFSSPVAYDLNKDGLDEVIISVNEYNCALGFNKQSHKSILNRLIGINFADNSIIPIDQSSGYKNIFTTPWIGDIDDDRYLDIVYCQYFNPSTDLMVFLGMKMKRIDASIKMKKPMVWGAYMGSEGNGVFQE